MSLRMTVLLLALVVMCVFLIGSVKAQFETAGGGSGDGGIIFYADDNQNLAANIFKQLHEK